MSDAARAADYRRDPDAANYLIEGLAEGDRVHIEADAAVTAEDDSPHSLFDRGDRVLIDDHATVREVKADGAVVVELDEQGVLTAEDDGYGATKFKIRGEAVIALWEVVDEDKADDGPFQPVNLQVAMLNRVERLTDE